MLKLNAKLKQYSALSAGLIVAGAKVGKTQILYTNVDPDVVVGQNGNIYIDLDNDAVNDIQLRQDFYVYYYYSSNVTTARNHPNADVIRFGTSNSRADRLDLGELIDVTKTYATSASVILGFNTFSTYDWSTSGPQVDKYLGVKLDKGTYSLYGWIRLDHALNSTGFTVKDYAVQMAHDKLIHAGDSLNLRLNDVAFTTNENVPNGTTIGTLAPVAAAGTLSYSILSGNTGNTFSVNAAGNLNVSDSTLLNFETNPSFALEIEVTDGITIDTAIVTVNVTDVNEAPVITPVQVFNVADNAANGTVVGTVVATDPENDATTFSITGGNTGSAFAISAAGELSVNDSSAFDFATTPSYTLTVEVTDGANTTDESVVVNLAHVIGIGEIGELKFGIYPNPVSAERFITIELPKAQKTIISVLDIQGKLIKRFTANTLVVKIETADLEKGIYIIQVEGANKESGVQRLIVQ